MKCINRKSFDAVAVPGVAAFYYTLEYYGTPRYRTYINTDEGSDLPLSGSKDDEALKQKVDQKYHIALWIQKARVCLYQNENKLFDLPRAFNVSRGIKMDRVRFEDGSAMLTNIRVAVGSPDTRNKLITEGLGETKPVAPNDTPVNKAFNRRVEFVKL
jgi:OOP family OmpA-OmpF porin